MKVLKTTVSFLAATLVFASCTRDENPVQAEDQAISQEVIDKVRSLNMNPEGMTLENVKLPDGTLETFYHLETDIFMPPEQLEAMVPDDVVITEHYRYINVVNHPRTISVIGYTGGVNGLTANMQTGLTWAVNNYNAVPGLTLTFTLTFATSTDADIVVYRDPATSGAGGAAGIPDTSGNPFKWLRLYAGLDNASNNVNEHVITHQMGHCIGMAHTDWENRESCGSGGGGGSSTNVVYIPGTPTGFDPGSIWNACFDFSTTGEFNANDILALQVLF
ncbi:M57 family metalloprotease [Ascidiimonas aurantiaca]|uniref:M57 family metalloprotease n=1 Tax=Ascidiimonas aurantiaca TaxID=1685432 RepID=UPI0030EBA458